MIRLDEALYDEVSAFLMNLPGFMGVARNDEPNQVYSVRQPNTGELVTLVIYSHSLETSAVERMCFVSEWALNQFRRGS